MNKLIEANYQSIVDRGLITADTKYRDFFKKLTEEYNEVRIAKTKKNKDEEWCDVILVALNYFRHHDKPVEKLLWEKVKKNQYRSKRKNMELQVGQSITTATIEEAIILGEKESKGSFLYICLDKARLILVSVRPKNVVHAMPSTKDVSGYFNKYGSQLRRLGIYVPE